MSNPKESLSGDVLKIRRISGSDLFGVFYVRKLNGAKWESYYKTIDSLRPLFGDRAFKTVVKGFYLNVCGDFDSVRISYFVDDDNSKNAIELFTGFFGKNGIVEIKDHAPPRRLALAKSYGGEEMEERFRNFLALETQVGLDLIKGDLLQARRLFATYRWQVRKAALPFRKHFEPTFAKHSPTYNSLSEEEKVQFFTDLEEWPNPPQVDWAHMMVNFVLGCDWNGVFSDLRYLTPGNPMTIPEINRRIKELGFQIPPDWKP